MGFGYESDRNLFKRIFHGQPITLRWQGWQSTTHALEREGWKITADERFDVYNNCHALRLGAQSHDTKVLISGTCFIHPQELLNPEYSSPFPGGLSMLFERGLSMQVYTFKDTYATLPEVDLRSLNSLKPINIYEPVDISLRNYRHGQLRCFQYVDEPAGRELFIPPTSVDECLNMILKIQHPEQQALKKSLLLPEKKPIIQAKIFSLAS